MAQNLTARPNPSIRASDPVLPQSKKKLIGEMLVEEGIVTTAQVDDALQYQKKEGGKLAEILIKLGHMNVNAFAKFISNQRGIPSIQLSNYQVSHDICKLVPREYAVKHEVFPIDKLGKLLTVGMCFPIDSDTIADLERTTGLRVKALMCSFTDLHNAIKSYYPEGDNRTVDVTETGTQEQIESSVKLANAAKMVRELDTLPTLPQTVRRVQEANVNQKISLREVAGIIETDPPVAARLLKLANSAAYGFPNNIDSVEMATSLLGLKETYMVVLSSAVIDLTAKSKHFDYNVFWKRSMICATAAKAIAKACGQEKNPAVFTAGLLHEIGRFALSEVVPGRYGKIDHSLCGPELIKAEETELGIAHPEAGYILADHWELPAEITEAIRFHHAPALASKTKETVMMVAAAAAMAEASATKDLDETRLFEHCGALLKGLGLNSPETFKIYSEALAASNEMAK